MIVNYEEIKTYLKHRYPFLLVDRVTEFEKDKRIVALKNITGNEMFFLGHFPEQAVMPGVLMIEAMAQTSALLFYLGNKSNPSSDEIVFLVGVDKARFTSLVIPGDQLKISAEPVKIIKNAGIVKCKVEVDEIEVAKCVITFGGKQG